jgi:hypothetical protein
MLRVELGDAIALAAMAGLRMGDVRDVEFEQRRILVRRALLEETSLTPKSGHEREVLLAAALEVRHYFVSELMKSGASAEAVRVLAGHSTHVMTQRYAHASPAGLRAAIDRLGK